MFNRIFSKIKHSDPVAGKMAETKVPPYTGTQHYCAVCNTNLAYFNPIDWGYLALLDKYEYNYSIFQEETFNFLKYSCPHCGAADRDRLYVMYFKERTKAPPKEKMKFIDFAPYEGVPSYFKKIPFLDYRSADLYRKDVDDNVDITDMKIYGDNTVDIFVCSHVLEHIEDDRKAMSELYRILKPGGWGIAMVPILTHNDHVVENLAITSDADRWKYYGQDDHVRFYNRKGFVERLEGAGFKVSLLGKEYFGEDQFERNGIHPRSILYIVEKI